MDDQNNTSLEDLQVDVDGARQELMTTEYADIQNETARKWLARALAAYELGTESETAKETISWLEFGNEYIHEALEHAALVEDGGELVQAIANAGAEAKHLLTQSIFGAEEGSEQEESEDQPEELFEEGEEGLEDSSEGDHDQEASEIIEKIAGKPESRN